MRGRPSLEVRLPMRALATGFADLAEADNTEAKVMRPNDKLTGVAPPLHAKLKARIATSG